jgi:glycosyltransferase involved in cell wall biosynthesis
MKIICHVTSVHKVYDGRIFEKECRSLVKAGYEVHLVAPNAVDHKKDGVIIHGVEVKKPGRIYRIFTFTNKIYRKALEIDAEIYHFHDPELLPLIRKLKKKGKIVIFDSHESVPEQIMSKEYIPILFRNLISKIYKLYEKKILKGVDAIITVTPHILDRLCKINPNTIQVTNYPIISELTPDQSNPTNSICFAGTIDPLWMHENIIDSIKPTPDISYHLAGPINDSYLRLLTSRGENVKYFGKLPNSEVIKFIRNSKIGMALYDYSPELGNNIGTLGNTKIFEYMWAGVPVICTDFLLWKNIFEERNCGICVNPRDVKAISGAIEFIMKNPKRAKVMALNGQQAVRTEYNWNSQEKILLKLYKELTFPNDR